jgi:hypothetical protein
MDAPHPTSGRVRIAYESRPTCLDVDAYAPDAAYAISLL